MDFWDAHGVGFILLMFWFPRLTMLFGTAVISTFGLVGWVGWLFMPRLTVAIIATSIYWETNIVLVIITWMWAFAGEAKEKEVMAKYGEKYE